MAHESTSREASLDETDRVDSSTIPDQRPATTLTQTQSRPGEILEPTQTENDTTQGKEDLDLERTVTLAQNISVLREILLVGIICTAQFTTQVGLMQALSSLHIFGQHFGINNSPGTLSWIVAGYSLTVGSFILIAGRFGDLYGYKRMLIIGYSWAALWSLVCGASYYSNHVLFVFARVLQGVGPSICLPNGLALLGATYPPGKKKHMVFAIFGATAPVGAITGATFSALFSQVAGYWPWTFFSFSITLVILAISAAVIIPHLPLTEEIACLSPSQKIRQLDLIGGAIGITALILINFAWNQSGVVTWRNPYVYVLLIVGFLLLPVFFWYEMKKSPFPLVPLELFSVDICFVLGLIALGWSSFGIWVFYIFQFLEISRGISPILACAQLSPVAATGFLAAITTGILLSRIRAAWVMTIALTAFLVGNILIGTAPIGQVYWAQTFVCTLVITFGMDMSFPAATVIISNALPKEKQGMGASLVNTVVNYSIALALGMAGTVERHVAHGDPLRGFRGGFYLAMGFAGSGLFLSLVFLARSYYKSTRKQERDVEEK